MMKVRVARDGLVEAIGSLEEVVDLVVLLAGFGNIDAVDRMSIGVMDGRASACWAAGESKEMGR